MPGSLRALWHSFRYCRTPDASVGGLARLVAASRLCVLPMTFHAVTMGALMAWLLGSFDPLIYLAVLAGFSLAHLADNLLNDLGDYRRGIDRPGYFRALYGPHPVIDGVVGVGAVKGFIAAVLAYNAALAALLSATVTPWVAVLAMVGVLAMGLYAGVPFDAKSRGLGELLVAVVWGPVMAGGTLLAMTGGHPPLAAAVYAPYAAAVSLVLVGKHMDKYWDDRERGVGTLPVRLGLGASMRLASALAAILPAAAALGVYAYTRSPLALLPLASYATALAAARMLGRPKPREPPAGWRVWPLWYAAAGYALTDSLGRAVVLSLLAAGLAASGNTAAAAALAALALAWEAAWSAPLRRVARAAPG